MHRKNCNENQGQKDDLPDLQSGNSDTKKSSYFSVVSSSLKSITERFLVTANKLGSRSEAHSESVVKTIKKSTLKYFRFYRLKNKKIAKTALVHCKNAVCEIKAPFNKIHKNYDVIKHKLLVELGNGFSSYLKLFKDICHNGYKNNRDMVLRFMNYVYPVAGGLILCCTIGYFSNLDYGLHVKCSGKSIGIVGDEYVFAKAKDNMHSRINYEGNQKPLKTNPEYTLIVLNKSNHLNSSVQVADKLLKNSNESLCEMVGLYVNDQFMGATKDASQLQKILDNMKKPYEDLYPNDDVSFVQNVDIEKGYYLASSLCKVDSIEKKIKSCITEPVIYTVQKGDAPLSIAHKNSVSYNELKSLNPNIEKDLKPGNEILVSKSKPFLEVKVVKECTVQDEIPFEVCQTVSKKHKYGYSKVAQQGQNGLKETTYKVTLIDGVESDKEVLNEKIIKKPVEHKLIVGIESGLKSYTNSNRNNSGSNSTPKATKLLWPVDGGYISCGMNGYRGHTGVDIAAHTGTTVRAAADGVVICSERKGAYGNHIMIQHDNGLVTLYAHNSSNHVTVGDRVHAGDDIGAVGSTGNAHGAHSHFEVRVNGRPDNPEKYICR